MPCNGFVAAMQRRCYRLSTRPVGVTQAAGTGSCLCAGGAFQAPLLAFQTASAGRLWMEGARALWEHFQTAFQSAGRVQQAAVATETLMATEKW